LTTAAWRLPAKANSFDAVPDTPTLQSCTTSPTIIIYALTNRVFVNTIERLTTMSDATLAKLARAAWQTTVEVYRQARRMQGDDE
jgi:hypothetical protein